MTTDKGNHTRYIGFRTEWFGNVEFVVAKEIGQETARYVNNIYKYYVAYKLELEQLELRKKAMSNTQGNRTLK